VSATGRAAGIFHNDSICHGEAGWSGMRGAAVTETTGGPAGETLGVLLAGGKYEAGSGKKRHLHVWNAPGVQAAARSPLASMVVHVRLHQESGTLGLVDQQPVCELAGLQEQT